MVAEFSPTWCMIFRSDGYKRTGNLMSTYEKPQIQALGSIESFTRGESFEWTLDGMTLSEALHHVAAGGPIGDVIGTS